MVMVVLPRCGMGGPARHIGIETCRNVEKSGAAMFKFSLPAGFDPAAYPRLTHSNLRG